MIAADTSRGYLAAQLSERVREEFDQLFYRKALSLRLEWFESTAYYDALQRARRAMQPEAIAEHLGGIQRFLSLILGCAAILWALGQVHWTLSLLLLLGSLVLIHAQVRGGRALLKVRFDQTRQQRKRDYW